MAEHDAPAIVDDGYRNLVDVARGCRAIADAIKAVHAARSVTLSDKATDRERADAYHVLLVHEPALRRESVRLASAAERLAFGRRK